MEKEKKMPTTKALLLLSWIVAFFGFLSGILLIVLNLGQTDILIKGFLILLATSVISLGIRLLANIGQMIFDIRSNLQGIRSICEHANCDLKDVNQGISQIKFFFEEIQKNLNLKK